MFLDHASTTKVHDTFLKAINSFASMYANPSSNHTEGLEARDLMKRYKKRIIDLVNEFYNTEFTHFILTSGATESINTVFNAFAQEDTYCFTDDIEHKATLESAKKYFYCGGGEYNIFSIKDPKISLPRNYDNVLLSLMTVNNETGMFVYNDKLIDLVYDNIQPKNTLLEVPSPELFIHTDNTQGFMKNKIDLHRCDMMSFSGHKIGTFKGIGGLFLNDRSFEILKKHPLIVGGGHQEGIRSGTENPLFIYALYQLLLEISYSFDNLSYNAKLCNQIARMKLREIADELNLELVFNSDESCSDYILDFAFKGIEGESVLTMLTKDSLATTSACNSEILESSYVLKALGVPNETANCSLRMSFNNNSIEEVAYFIEHNFKNAIKKLAQMRVRKTK